MTILQQLFPDLLPLATERGQRQLKLTDEQKQKLSEIAAKLLNQCEKYSASLGALPPDEDRERKMDDLHKEHATRIEEARKEAVAVLSPEQLTQLKEIAFRTYTMGVLNDPRVLDQIEASEDQKGQLRKLSEECWEKSAEILSKLQEEMLDNALKVLTPEQQRKLRDMMEMQSAARRGF